MGRSILNSMGSSPTPMQVVAVQYVTTTMNPWVVGAFPYKKNERLRRRSAKFHPLSSKALRAADLR
jgi:hypothetical protein